MILTPPDNNLSRHADFLTRLSNYLLGFALLCYVCGFAITNMYLGSLGIVNLDLLRARYILAGILFLLFLSAISYLIHGLIRTLRMNRHLPSQNLIWRVMVYSMQNIAILYFAVPALAIFAGVKGLSVTVTQSTSSMSWSIWLATEPRTIFYRTAVIYFGLMIAVCLIFAILLVINPKNKHGIRTPRRRILGDAFDGLSQEKASLFKFLVGSLVLILAFTSIPSLLTFIALNQVGNTGSAATLLPEGWDRFFIAIVLIYAFVAIFLLFLFIFPSSSESGQDENPLAVSSAWIYLITVAIVILVPVYAIGIYPHLPQQIGGGKALRVEAIISVPELKAQFVDQNTETYLIDRTTSSSLFLLVDKNSQSTRIIEIPGNLVQSITYSSPP